MDVMSSPVPGCPGAAWCLLCVHHPLLPRPGVGSELREPGVCAAPGTQPVLLAHTGCSAAVTQTGMHLCTNSTSPEPLLRA